MTRPSLDNPQRATRIAEAIINPARWEAVLSEMEAALGAVGATIFNPAPGTFPSLQAASGTTKASLPEYARHWIGQDAWINAPTCRQVLGQAGNVGIGTEVLSTAALRMTDFHADFLRLYDIERILTLSVTDASDPVAPATFVSFYRPASMANFGLTERMQLTRLWKQLQHAIHAHWMLERSRHTDRLAEDALDALPEAAVVLRIDGTVEFANKEALLLLKSRGCLTFRQGKLHSIGSFSAPDLTDWLRYEDSHHTRAWVTALPSEPPRPAMLYLVPLSESPAYALRWPRAYFLLLIRLPLLPESRTQWAQRLAELYRFTPAELRVLDRLARGLEPKRIATELGISYDTVRTHLRKLLEKTGCNRQVELILLANSI